jgi:hypothetical protein
MLGALLIGVVIGAIWGAIEGTKNKKAKARLRAANREQDLGRATMYALIDTTGRIYLRTGRG